MPILGLLILLLALKANCNRFHSERCEPITIHMCKDLPYNSTIFPNLMRNQNQEEAESQIRIYQPLVKIQCSADIQLFLCSMYAPVCTILDKPLKPCRDLCESARKGCESLMKTFSYSWPAAFDCSLFPPKGSEEICMGRNSQNAVPNEFDLQRFRYF